MGLMDRRIKSILLLDSVKMDDLKVYIDTIQDQMKSKLDDLKKSIDMIQIQIKKITDEIVIINDRLDSTVVDMGICGSDEDS